MVDGAQNYWPSSESTRHFEVARHFSLTRHVLAPEVLVASARSWQKLEPDQQQLLQEAADESVPYMRALGDARVEESRARMLAHGVELVEDVDHAAFRARRRHPRAGRGARRMNALLAALALVTYVPVISLWLPAILL